MFKIDFFVFICYYLIGQLIFFLWIWSFGRKAVVKQHFTVSDQVWQCAICLYVYFVPKTVKISTCPVCGSLNKKFK